MINIVQSDNPVLRECAQTVAIKDIKSEKIQNIIRDMKIALSTQKDGVAIAAPQIGIPLRIFVVSDSVLKEADKNFKSNGKDIVFINPEITKLSREKDDVEEGCLSVRWKYGKVKRSTKATVKGYNELGEIIELIFNQYALNRTYNDIAFTLNLRGYVTKTGKRFTAANVFKLFKDNKDY